MTSSGNDFWFNNVKKGDTGVKLNIIPSEEGEKIEIKSDKKHLLSQLTKRLENVCKFTVYLSHPILYW